jgi:Flp pilus assembly protein TadG
MQMKRDNNFNRKERGQSLVELAFSFMLVMIIFSGAVDFGRAYFALVALRDGAQEGVVYASVYPDDQSLITQRVHTSSTNPIDMTTTVVNVECGPSPLQSDCSDACAGFSYTGVNDPLTGQPGIESNFVTVIVAYDFDFTMPFITAIIGSETIPLTVRQTHTILSPSC